MRFITREFMVDKVFFKNSFVPRQIQCFYRRGLCPPRRVAAVRPACRGAVASRPAEKRNLLPIRLFQMLRKLTKTFEPRMNAN